jgi:hypothetical protein
MIPLRPHGILPKIKNCADPTAHPHPQFWSRNELLPDWARKNTIRYADGSEERLGVRLDGALDCLYKWCVENDVPILAHTNTTNGVDCVYPKLATAEHWRKAFAVYPELRASFGHMGGFEIAGLLSAELDTHTSEVPKTIQATENLLALGQRIDVTDEMKISAADRIAQQSAGQQSKHCLSYLVSRPVR